MAIHPSAIVDPKAELDSSVEVGPYSIIGPNVKIGARTRVGPHVVIEGHTTIGEDNHIFQFASLGGKAGNALVAVVQRLGHALHGLDRSKPAQQLLQAGLFFGKLFTVGQRQQRAAAAFQFIIGAGYRHGV